MFFSAYFGIDDISQTQDNRTNNVTETSPQSYKTQVKILAYLGLAYSRFKQPSADQEIEPDVQFSWTPYLKFL